MAVELNKKHGFQQVMRCCGGVLRRMQPGVAGGLDHNRPFRTFLAGGLAMCALARSSEKT
jgi:hypothetical protein